MANEKTEIQGVLLTKAQLRVLETADYSTTHSGRGGWSENTMRAMEKLGLVSFLRASTWEKYWRFTDLGDSVRNEAQRLLKARYASRP